MLGCRLLRSLILFGASLVMTACQSTEIVDGWPLGRVIPCEMTANEPDARAALQAELTATYGSLQVIGDQCRFPGPFEVDGNPVYWGTGPGGVELHVLAFADGTHHVVALSCPGRTPPAPGSPPVIGPRCHVMARP